MCQILSMKNKTRKVKNNMIQQLSAVDYNVFDITDFKNALHEKANKILRRALWIQFSKKFVRRINIRVAKDIHTLQSNYLEINKRNMGRFFRRWKSKMNSNENSELNIFTFEDDSQLSSENLIPIKQKIPKLSNSSSPRSVKKRSPKREKSSPVVERKISSPKISEQIEKEPPKKLKRIKRKSVNPIVIPPTSTDLWQQFCNKLKLKKRVELCTNLHNNLEARRNWIYFNTELRKIKCIKFQNNFYLRRRWQILLAKASISNIGRIYLKELNIEKATDFSNQNLMRKMFDAWKSAASATNEYDYYETDSISSTVIDNEIKDFVKVHDPSSTFEQPQSFIFKGRPDQIMSEIEEVHSSSIERFAVEVKEKDSSYSYSILDVTNSEPEIIKLPEFEFKEFETEIRILLWNISSEAFPHQFPAVGDYFSLNPQLRSDYVEEPKSEPKVEEISYEEEDLESDDQENTINQRDVDEILEEEEINQNEENKEEIEQDETEEEESLSLEEDFEKLDFETSPSSEKKQHTNESDEDSLNLTDTVDEKQTEEEDEILVPVPVQPAANPEPKADDTLTSDSVVSSPKQETQNDEIPIDFDKLISDVTQDAIGIKFDAVLSFLDTKLAHISYIKESESQISKNFSDDINNFLISVFNNLIIQTTVESFINRIDVVDTIQVRKTNIHKKDHEELDFTTEFSEMFNEAFAFTMKNALSQNVPDL